VAEATIAALRNIHGDEPVVDNVSKKISVPAPEGSKSLMQAVRALDEAQITPDDMTLRKPTLDDVFLSLTGHIAKRPPRSPTPGGRRRRPGRNTE
jgi:ABC-2 type transport system ATP-binding protein